MVLDAVSTVETRASGLLDNSFKVAIVFQIREFYRQAYLIQSGVGKLQQFIPVAVVQELRSFDGRSKGIGGEVVQGPLSKAMQCGVLVDVIFNKLNSYNFEQKIYI